MIGSLANPLFLFAAVWGTTTLLYLAGVFAGLFPSPHPMAVGALLLNGVAFPVGYVTWTLFGSLGSPRVGVPLLRTRPATPQRVERALVFTLLMGVIALLLTGYRVAVIAGRTGTSLMNLVTEPEMLRLRLVSYIEAGTSEADPLVMLISLTSSLFAVGFVLLGVFLHLDRRWRKYVYLCAFLAVSLAICLANLSRAEMTVQVVALVLAYCAAASHDGRRKSMRMRNLLAPVLGVVVLFAVIEVLLRKGETYGQADRLRGVLYSFYWYLASPLAAFNEFVANFHEQYHLGQNTFFPVYKWLHRFDLVGEPSSSIYRESVFVPYRANVYTYLQAFYKDFGILGVTIAPYALGTLLAAIQHRARRHFGFLNLYVILLVTVAFSFFNYRLLSIQLYMQIAFGFLLFRYALPDGCTDGDLQGDAEEVLASRWAITDACVPDLMSPHDQRGRCEV